MFKGCPPDGIYMWYLILCAGVDIDASPLFSVLTDGIFYLGEEHETKPRVQHRCTDDDFKQPIIEIEDGVTY